MIKHANRFMRCTLVTAVIALGVGCGGGSDGAKGTGDDRGTGTDGATSEPAGQDCEGAFTSVEAPYVPNNAVNEWGGFVADEQGLVFSAITDSTQPGFDAELPSIIATSDLSGNVETIYTVPDTAMPGKIFAFGDDIYFVEGLLSHRIMKLARAGGEATMVSDDLEAGPVSDGDKLYYAVRESGGSSIVALDMASGETETLTPVADTIVVAIAVDGDKLYFADAEDYLSEADYSLYSVSTAGGDPELVMQLPYDTALGSFTVVGDVGFGSAITEDFSIVINRFEFGEAPVVVEDQGGMPMVIAEDTIYYNGREGLMTNSLDFDDPGVISDAGGRGIGALAVSESFVWYASGRCVYKAPR